MLEKLKEYKELITIIMFFLGGITWLNAQFPTKADLKSEVSSLKADLMSEVSSLNCLLEKYMTLTQLQIARQEIEKQAQELGRSIAKALPDDIRLSNVPLSPAMEHEIAQLKDDHAAKKKELRHNETEMNGIRNELGRNVCAKVIE